MNLNKKENQATEKMTLIELANLVLLEEKEQMAFSDLFEKVVELKKLTDEEKERNLSQFYTDLNMDGRFVSLGSNVWGLKQWFPLSQMTDKGLKELKKEYEGWHESLEEYE